MTKRRVIILISSLVLFASLGYWWTHRWTDIVIHHSAGSYGEIEFLQKVHRERQSKDPIDAIPYHFIIGNGNGLAMGEVASDWRQKWHIWGAHVSGNNTKRNLFGLGICLIGNYEKGHLPAKQYEALVKLTRSLMDTYDIPIENISGHGWLEGESTLCPGKYFPKEQFFNDIQS
ncbi:MAG: peptidoglycan recognition family protein [Bacteroidota bacterium]